MPKSNFTKETYKTNMPRVNRSTNVKSELTNKEFPSLLKRSLEYSFL